MAVLLQMLRRLKIIARYWQFRQACKAGLAGFGDFVLFVGGRFVTDQLFT
jgi:hypothetical protein